MIIVMGKQDIIPTCIPSKDYDKENSAHKAVTTYLAAGVPAHKLVVGLAFYGRGGVVETVDDRGFNQKINATFRVGGWVYFISKTA